MTRVLFLVYDDVEVLDFSGPFDVFSMADVVSGGGAFELATISADGGPVTAMHGLKIVPDCGFGGDGDHGDVVIVPGGVRASEKDFGQRDGIVDWVAGLPDRFGTVATICIGALIGARAGLFDGRRATTHHSFFGQLDEFSGGKATVVRGPRYVVNDGAPLIASSAGVSAGIDLSFWLLGRVAGDDVRDGTMELMEYNGTRNWAATA